MPLLIVNGDITKMKVDAIVNAANSSLLGGGGVDGAIHRAAGPMLLAECSTLGGCDTGDAKITGGYDLPARYVIHTVGPVWHGGTHGEPELLASCYRRSLELAVRNACETVAFPLISTGVYGYPVREGFEAARDTIASFLQDHDLTVYIVIYGAGFFEIDPSIRKALGILIRDKCRPVEVEECCDAEAPRTLFGNARRMAKADMCAAGAPVLKAPAGMDDLAKRVSMIDESFSQMLLRKIDELGMTDVQCYKKANLDRKHFSKIRSDKDYRPKKQTVLALAVALELPLQEMRELLMKAGYALSDSSVSDVIISYFIEKGNYNIYDINEALFAFDQPLLGAV